MPPVRKDRGFFYYEQTQVVFSVTLPARFWSIQ
jgi:hypothetical protein